jgi:hypothetical protein
MRAKLTVCAVLAALLAATAIAQAAPITVALYRFSSGGEAKSFYRVGGKSCKRKWRKHKTLGISVGAKTKRCPFRSSVVGDSADPGPDQEMAAEVNLAAATPAKIRSRIYMGVSVRQADETGYQLRIQPAARKWQVLRDPRGNAGPTVIGAGRGRFIRQGVGVRNLLTLRAFDYGSAAVTLQAKVNRKRVLSIKDSNADIPNGRRTVVTIGARGRRLATGAVGSFDNVAIRVPNPF